MRLLRVQVLGSTRTICLISDHHAGLLNAAAEHIDGFPPLVHRWCMRHFAANFWRRQQKQEVCDKVNALCCVRRNPMNHDHDSLFSPTAKAKAMGTIWSSGSIATTIIKVHLYFPIRKVPSTSTTSRQNWNACSICVNDRTHDRGHASTSPENTSLRCPQTISS